MSSEKESFNEWFEEVKRLAEPIIIIDKMALRDYFYEGLSPDEALRDYLS